MVESTRRSSVQRGGRTAALVRRVRELAVAAVAGTLLAGLVTLPLARPAAAAGPADWPAYLHDSHNTAAGTDTSISPALAPTLRPAWTTATGGTISAGVTVVGNRAYVGSWDGYQYALDAATGAVIWKTFLGITTAPTCFPPEMGVSSTAVVVGGTLYVGGGDAYWYALDAATGAVLWRVYTGDNSAEGGHYNWASPLIVGNAAYIGISSVGDCPLVQGEVLKVDLTTHDVVASIDLVPDGQVGAGVWTTPAYDATTDAVLVTTGTLNQAEQVWSQAIVSLDAGTLAVKGSWQIPDEEANYDSDWGTSPILFEDALGRELVAGINKNGFLYAVLRGDVSAGPVWETVVAISGVCPTCGDGSVSSMAFAQGRLFVAGGNTTIGGQGYPGAIRALDPTTGGILWERGTTEPVVPALAWANGVVYAGAGASVLALDGATGAMLFSYEVSGPIYSPPSVGAGKVFIGAADGTVYAFAPVAPIVPPADPACPAGWTCQAIGGASPAGTQSVTGGGAWTVTGGGAGIGAGGTDQLRLATRPASGDLELRARVTAWPTPGTARAGLMVRQSNEAGAPFYAVTATGANGLSVQRRSAFGGPVTSLDVALPSVPAHLAIRRLGDTFSVATSTNGTAWTLVAGTTAAVVLPTAVMAGLVATSGVAGVAGTAAFDTVSLGAPGAAPNPPSGGACPSGWTCTDVGDPAVVGDQALALGTWTVRGAGTGMAAYADQLHLVSQPFAADATMTVRLDSLTGGAGAQAGLVFRSGATAPGAVGYGALVTGDGRLDVIYRNEAGLRTVTVTSGAAAPPAWLRISRWQSTYSTFTSTDGVAWSLVLGSSVTEAAANPVVGGLAVASGNPGALATATFAAVAANASATAPPSVCPAGWTCGDVNLAGIPGSQAVTGSTWTVQGSGGDIWDTADSFRFVRASLAGDGTVRARLLSQTNTDPWAKAGLMVRTGPEGNAPNYAVFATPANGIIVQWRPTTGAITAQIRLAATLPSWLQIGRVGSTFTAFTSTDGVTWTPIPGSTVTLPALTGTLLAGPAITSHDIGELGTAVYDGVAITP